MIAATDEIEEEPKSAVPVVMDGVEWNWWLHRLQAGHWHQA